MSGADHELDELLTLVGSDEVADVERAQARLLAWRDAPLRARVMAAMAYDRLRALGGRPQKFGTQAVLVAGAPALWPVDRATTDSERAKWSVGPLAVLQQNAAAAPRVGKAPLRRLARQKRAQLPQAIAERHGYAIAEHGVALLDKLVECRTVAAYWPLPGEADPRPLARLIARRRGAKLALPVVAGDDMTFREWRDDGDLGDAGFGTFGPPPSAPECVPDVVLVPLVGWDAEGGRLGQGRGYYDRKLAALPPTRTVGVAFDCQRLPRVPTEAHDRGLDALVSETGSRTFHGPGC